MGLFGGLFDKKHCNFCGGDIGMLGNRKLEDGNMCKNCASKLSPWFSDRRHSTVMEINAQLDYRAANQLRVNEFVVTRQYGESFNKILIDDNMQAFMVTSATNLYKANPDIFDFGCVVACVPNVHEHRHEIKHPGPDGHEVSYNPPRYRYEYDFSVKLQFNHPYVDDIHVNLNSGDVEACDPASLDYFATLTEDVVETMTLFRPDVHRMAPFRPLPPEPMMMPPHHMPAPGPAPSPRPAPAPAPMPGRAPAPTRPAAPVPPARPAQPVPPAAPARPTAPVPPARPTQPVPPAAPARPTAPVPPARPTQPVPPAAPVRPGAPAAPARPAQPAGRPSAPTPNGKPGPGGIPRR